MKLTHGKLIKGPNCRDWQDLEYLQLNQYNAQGMFGPPTLVNNDTAVFHTVWTYNVKALDHCKKARCVCDGSPRAGKAIILDETYTNCVEQTSSRMFYGISAAENLLVYDADVSNAFAKAPPPKQGFYMYPDRAFHEWWERHLLRPPLNPGEVIPVLSAMQGHPESPHFWEKHSDYILRDIGLTPTIHEPCLYSGIINGNRVLLKCQVNNFAIPAPNKLTANILLNLINTELSILMKQQGYLDMFNGIDVLQTRDYIKISSSTFINKISEKYLSSWMHNFRTTSDRPTPLPLDPTWTKKLNAAIGDPDSIVQKKLATSMQLSYLCGIEELLPPINSKKQDLLLNLP
jgi:hypothetical protein